MKADPGGFPERRLTDVPVVDPPRLRETQRLAQEEFSVDILQITENAGRSVATLAHAMLGRKAKGQRIIVLAGGGNKGAAGLAAVRHLVNWGFVVEPIFAELETEMSFIARRQIQILRHAGIVEPGDQASSELTVEDHLADAELVIDALIGYGLKGPPTGMAAAVTQLAVDARRPILALDMPTGVSAYDGQPSTPAIRATTTLALDLPKRGLIEPVSRGHTGELFLAELGIPRVVHERMGIAIGSTFADGPIVRLRR